MPVPILKEELQSMFGDRATVTLIGPKYIRVELDIEFQMSDWTEDFREVFFTRLGSNWEYELGDDGNLNLFAKEKCPVKKCLK